MSAVIVVTKDKKQVAKVTVPEGTFIIGRSSRSGLPLDDSEASRHHAEITFAKGRFWIRDLETLNGTLVNGKKLAGLRELKDGDEIVIGGIRMAFHWENTDDAATVAGSVAELEKKISRGKAAEKKAGKGDGALQVKLRVTEGPRRGMVLQDWESPLRIGRGPENQIILLDTLVSEFHAEIITEGERFFIVDLNSTNQTFLGGLPIKRAELKSGQKIAVGESTMVFELVDLRKRRRRLNFTLIGLLVLAVVFLLVKLSQPPDVAGHYVGEAVRQYNDTSQDLDARLKGAEGAYKDALRIDPNRAEAKKGLAKIDRVRRAKTMLATAESAARAGEFSKAADICESIIREFDSPRAKELAAVVQSCKDANVAATSRDWSAAEILLNRALEKYRAFPLIQSRLELVKQEAEAKQILTRAKDAIQHQQIDSAKTLLEQIPTNSVYFNESRQYLDKINNDQNVEATLTKARGLFCQGLIAEASAALSGALDKTHNDPRLDEFLNKRVKPIEPLVGPLESAVKLTNTRSVEDLLLGQKSCEAILALNESPDCLLVVQAKAARGQIVQWLQTASLEALARGASLRDAGNRKDALAALELAVKADGNNKAATDARNELRDRITSECKKLYNDGRNFAAEQLYKQARENFNKVLEIGSPGQRYFDLAGKDLAKLPPQ